jgi:hypothetical protein
MNKINNIKDLYSQINKKTKFISMVADDLSKSPQYVRGHWFSAFWTIPECYRDRVIELLQNTITNQEIKVEA